MDTLRGYQRCLNRNMHPMVKFKNKRTFGTFHTTESIILRSPIRFVFDCAAEYESESLNKHLIQGPNLTNNLTGVLCRFRQEPIAFMCDIEAMFHQVKVSEEFRDLLRFLWWEDGDLTKEPKEY